MPKKHIVGTRELFRLDLPTAQKANGMIPLGVTPPEGTTQGSGMMCSEFFNEIFYRTACDWVVGKKDSDVIKNNANCYYDSDSQTFKDKEHNTITFLTGDRIHFYGLDPLTADMVFNADELEVSTKEGLYLDLGDNSGQPYQIIINGKNCKFDIKTNQDTENYGDSNINLKSTAVFQINNDRFTSVLNGRLISTQLDIINDNPNASAGIKVDTSNQVDNYYLRCRNNGASKFNVYENSSNIYIDSHSRTTFRTNNFGGSGGYYRFDGPVGFNGVPTVDLEVFGKMKINGMAGGVPIGSTVLWWGTAVPNKWLACDGSEISEAAYPELYAELTANLNFPIIPSPNRVALPDTRDMFIRGWHGSNRNDAWADGDAANRQKIDETPSGYPGQAGSYQAHGIPDHNHGFRASDDGTAGGGVSGGAQYQYVDQNTDGVTGANTSPDTRPNNISAMYIIRAEY